MEEENDMNMLPTGVSVNDGDEENENESKSNSASSQSKSLSNRPTPSALPALAVYDEWLASSSSSSASSASSSRSNRKLRVKELRAYTAVERAEGRPLSSLFSHTPTAQLYVCNAGISCGVTPEQVSTVFRAYGCIVDLVLIGLCPFALVSYESVEEATKARDDRNSKPCKEMDDRILFIHFAQKDASCFSSCSSEHRLQIPSSVFLDAVHPISCFSFPHLAEYLSHPQFSPSFNCFDGDHIIPGLTVITDFLSEAEERDCAHFVQQREWEKLYFRSVQHYGNAFNYDSYAVDEPIAWDGVFPGPLEQIAKRLQWIETACHDDDSIAGISPFENGKIGKECESKEEKKEERDSFLGKFVPNQLTVNKYTGGCGIPPHVDTPQSFTDVVVSLSLCSSVVMEFTPISALPHNRLPAAVSDTLPPAISGMRSDREKEREYERAKLSLLQSDPSAAAKHSLSIVLPPRSLLLLRGKARYEYTHSIPQRKFDRYSGGLQRREERISLTYRRVKNEVLKKIEQMRIEALEKLKRNSDKQQEMPKREQVESKEKNDAVNTIDSISSDIAR